MAYRFASDVYRRRLERARTLTRSAGLDALVVSTGPDLRYLTGSRADTFERLTALVISADADPRLVVARLEVASVRDSALDDLDVEMAAWVDGEDPYELALAGLPDAARIAVCDTMPALHVIPIARRTGATPALATDVLRELRMTKDGSEIDALRQAGAAIDRVHARMGEWLTPGRTERAVADDIRTAILDEGHTEAAFIIVGSGPHGADPHHEFSDRVIEADDIVVIDIGGPLPGGYNSDCTRTYAVGGEPGPDVKETYAVLQEAQERAVAAVRPGATAADIDRAADIGAASYIKLKLMKAGGLQALARGSSPNPRAKHDAGSRQRGGQRRRLLDGRLRGPRPDRQRRRDERFPQAPSRHFRQTDCRRQRHHGP